MDAMIFAAGLGTRLRPLTDTIPKALIEVGGIPILERVARRLIAAGATRLVVNVHHHADQVRRFIEERDGFGVETLISAEEEELLETGGGLLHAARLFRRDRPFILHNGDIMTDLDLRALYDAHDEAGALATVAVMRRATSRHLLFDATRTMCGYSNGITGVREMPRAPVGMVEEMAFCGVHVISPRIFDLIVERGAFSIIPLYLRLVGAGHRIARFDFTGDVWVDIGRPEELERARLLAT